MRSRSQKVLAVALLATALCADRAISATPAFAVESGSGTFASRLVGRLTVNLRRVIPSTRVFQARRDEPVRQRTVSQPVIASVTPVPFAPFEFRLPPPTVA